MRRAPTIEAYQAVGARLAQVRNDGGLTQRQLAERVGRPPSYIAKIELGERRLDVLDLGALAEALSLSPGALAERLLEGLAG